MRLAVCACLVFGCSHPAGGPAARRQPQDHTLKAAAPYGRRAGHASAAARPSVASEDDAVASPCKLSAFCRQVSRLVTWSPWKEAPPQRRPPNRAITETE